MKERRKGPRFDVVLQAHYESREDFQAALIHSISEVGVYLETDTPFDIGYRFLLEIYLPEKGECEVVWINQIETRDYPKGMGVKFIELAQKERRLLENYIGDLCRK